MMMHFGSQLLQRLLLRLVLRSQQPFGRAAVLQVRTVSSLQSRPPWRCGSSTVASSAAAAAAGLLHEGQCVMAWRRWHVDAHVLVAGPEPKPGQAVAAATRLHLKHNIAASVKHAAAQAWSLWLMAEHAAATTAQLLLPLCLMLLLDVQRSYSTSKVLFYKTSISASCTACTSCSCSCVRCFKAFVVCQRAVTCLLLVPIRV